MELKRSTNPLLGTLSSVTFPADIGAPPKYFLLGPTAPMSDPGHEMVSTTTKPVLMFILFDT